MHWLQILFGRVPKTAAKLSPDPAPEMAPAAAANEQPETLSTAAVKTLPMKGKTFTGPRGGRYTIDARGRKRYISA